MKIEFGDHLSDNVAKFHRFFEKVLCPVGLGIFWLMLIGSAGLWGYVLWSYGGEKDWWLLFRLIATLVAIILGAVLGYGGGAFTLLGGAIIAALLGYPGCFVTALVQHTSSYVQESRRLSEERDKESRRLIEERAKERETAGKPSSGSATRFEIKATKADCERIKSLMNQIDMELAWIKSPQDERIKFSELRKVIEAELQQSVEQENWMHLHYTIRAASDELQGYQRIDHSLAEMGLSRDQLTASALKKTYFGLAKKFHPDAAMTANGERMTRINAAKHILECYLNATTKV